MVLSRDQPQSLKQKGAVDRKTTSPELQALLCYSLDWGRGFGSSRRTGISCGIAAALGHGGMQVGMGLVRGATRGFTDPRGRFAVPMPCLKQDADPSSVHPEHRGWAEHLKLLKYQELPSEVTRRRGKFGGEPCQGRSGSSPSCALSRAAPPGSLFPWDVPAGREAPEGCARPARCAGSSECQPCVTGTPSSLPAAIKLLLTWDPISFIAARTFPPCQPLGRGRENKVDI